MRPQKVKGTTTKIQTGCGNLYITINIDKEKKPFEIFIKMGKSGGCASSQLETTGRLISLALRKGASLDEIYKQINAIRCSSPSWIEGGQILSCSDAIAKIIKKNFLNDKKDRDTIKPERMDHLEKGAKLGKSKQLAGVCPECSDNLYYESGCNICKSCGYSKCG